MSKKMSFDANKALDEIKKDRNLTMVALGAVGVLLGLFLPWYSTNVITTSYRAGIMLALFSVVAVAASLNVMNQDAKTMKKVAIVVSVLALLVMLNNWPDSDLGGSVSTGIGYWLGFAGSASMIFGSVMRQKESSKK